MALLRRKIAVTEELLQGVGVRAEDPAGGLAYDRSALIDCRTGGSGVTV
jgi:hypothetical protein